MRSNWLFVLPLVSLLIGGCFAQSNEKVLIGGEEIAVLDAKSTFFHESIKARLQALDTTLSPKHLLAYTYFVQQTAPFNPAELDVKAEKMYQLNETGNYTEALEKGRELRAISPNNITALKEMGYAFKRLGQTDSVQIYFVLMVKAIEGAKLSGDGGANAPYVLNHSFELTSLIEATYGLHAQKAAVFKNSEDRVVVLSIVRSPKIGTFALLNHWSKYLKKGEYTEGDFPFEDPEKQLREAFEKKH